MGLAQRALEAAGFTTITLSTIAAFTASVGAPRVAAIEYPLGRPFGQPGDGEGQTRVLRATLRALVELDRPGVVDLPFRWPERRARWHPRKPPPIAGLIRRKPWLLRRLMARDIPESG